MNICSIYCFTNLINQKKYIGSTINEPGKRYKQHLQHAFNEKDSKYHYPLYCAIRKYGLENFSFDVLESKECSEKEIREIEHEYIIKYNTVAPNGYNQTSDTEHPINDPLTYIKVRETKRENAKRVAEVDANNTILKIWRSIIDCVEENPSLNEKKIAAVCRGERKTTQGKIFYWLDENDNLIIPEYTRDLYKGEKGTTQIQSSSRKVAKIDLQTKEILDIYDTIALAARENGCDNSAISKVCRGVRKKCGGFGWQYIDI